MNEETMQAIKTWAIAFGIFFLGFYTGGEYLKFQMRQALTEALGGLTEIMESMPDFEEFGE